MIQKINNNSDGRMNKGVFLYTEEFQMYDMGPHHPLRPTRLKRTYDLLQSYGAFNGIEVAVPKPCSLDDLRAIHSDEYIESVDRLSSGEHVPFPYHYGFATGDNPVFPDMWEASLLYTGASADAARAVNEQQTRVAVNISGGLHHAHKSRAAGFCIFNDCAVATHILREKYDRVAYVDIDVHHGDGVQEAFYDDPSVLTVSIHETGFTLFPGTGFPHESGAGDAVGTSLNIPMWPYTIDEYWLYAWREAAMPVLKAFQPDAICLQMGADPHYLDPMARLSLTAQGWMEAVKDIITLDKPLVVVGGGGYNPAVVPRMWTLACSELFGLHLPDDTPECFTDHAAIPTLTDHDKPPVTEYDLEQAHNYAKQTVEEIKSLIFPHYGL